MLDQNDANRRLSVMVVDDSVDILRAVFLVLRRDYKVYPVPDSTQLEEVLRHITPDLFLLDYSMPQINGLELIPIIREFPEHEDTPIIILTGVGTKDRLAAAVLLGVCDFLDKPVQADMLRRKIGEHIAKKNI
jgi:CheY-like chemotaxis protein